jgi:hypothetical protein
VIDVATLCSQVALFGGVAVLALSLAAKLAGWEATRAGWPVTGPGRRLAGPAQVTAAESLVVATALAPLPVPVRTGLIAIVFAAYALAAVALRGHRCACFGSWIPTRFTWRHAAACAAIAGPAGGGMFGTEPASVGSAEAGGGLVLAVLLAGWLRRRRAGAGDVRPPAEAEYIVIFTTESCGFCAALEAQRGRYEAMTACPVEFRQADSEEDVQAAGAVFPAAVAYGPDGLPVSGPAHGLAGIRDLLRRSTPPATKRAAGPSRRPETQVIG